MFQAWMATHPRLRRIWIVVMSAAWFLCWPAVLMLGGCSSLREMNAYSTHGFWKDHENRLPLDLAEAQAELRTVGF